MAGSLLVSGNPQNYKAIGEGGQPVYAVAFQLREAIRLKAGVNTANCLAIPQSNQHGSTVDWYSPIPGDVVPWSAATSQEREQALAKLDAAHRGLERAISQMSLSQSRDAQAEREKNTVLPLMSKVFYFPDTNFVYLVNGEPVIAFWGFHSGGAHLLADPFTHLRPVPPSPVATEAEPPQKARAWWWWLLLLLLLLLLLFFLLRSCAPGVLPVAIQPAPTTAPDALTLDPGTSTNPVSNGGIQPPPVSADPGARVDRGVSILRPGLPGSAPVAVDTGSLGSVPATGTGVPVETTTPDAGAINPGTNSGVNSVEPPSGGIAENPVGTPPASNPVADKPTTNPADTSAPNAANPNSPGAPVSPPAADPTGPPGAGAQPGRPMSIPPQALNSGDTRFLDGSWSAGTGIQDAKTGKPLRMEYDFSQGKGQGKVTIRRADGSQCVGAVSAQMQSRSLQISDRGVAKCSDGSTMALPKVTCTPQADGRADCQGRYENGTTFPVSMRHSPK